MGFIQVLSYFLAVPPCGLGGILLFRFSWSLLFLRVHPGCIFSQLRSPRQRCNLPQPATWCRRSCSSSSSSGWSVERNRRGLEEEKEKPRQKVNFCSKSFVLLKLRSVAPDLHNLIECDVGRPAGWRRRAKDAAWEPLGQSHRTSVDRNAFWVGPGQHLRSDRWTGSGFPPPYWASDGNYWLNSGFSLLPEMRG